MAKYAAKRPKNRQENFSRQSDNGSSTITPSYDGKKAFLRRVKMVGKEPSFSQLFVQTRRQF